MPQMMDKPTENPSEDRASLESNGKTPTNGVFHSVRTSIQQVVENIPQSPSLSAGSPVTSPLKNIAGFFQKKKEDEAEDPPGRKKGLKRSQTAPNMAWAGGSMRNTMRSIRQSLRSNNKTDIPISKVPAGDQKEEKEGEEVVQEEVVQEEVVWEEAYTLPEIPHTPLSVMQINKLIDMEVLEEAHLNLLALRQEFKQEYSGEDSPMQLAKKEKDLSLLYGYLREKISTIVRNSNSFPSRNKELLVLVARIIQEEERRSDECGGLQDSWMGSWREAVGEGVQMKVDSVHLEQSEQNISWLAVHLGLLGKAIVEDLENVKRELQSSYPPSFKVFSTYVNSYHRVLGQHLKKLEQQVTDLKDMHALLDWIINRYKSDKIMGSAFLQADMKDESLDLQLEDDFLEKLRDKYCCRVKEDLSFSLTRITDIENEEVWMEKKVHSDTVEDFPTSNIVMDIWTRVKGFILMSGKIDAQLKQKVTCSCLEELKQFPKRFETEFRSHCSSLRPQPLWTDYQITYINSFSALQQPMEEYQAACPDEVEGFRREVRGLIDRLMEDLEDQFKESVKPYLRRMMTRKWLTSDEDFKQLQNQTKLLSLPCSRMRPPHAQEFASRLHYHVVKEYIGQLMKNNYSCKNRKHEKAAMKIREQCCVLRDLFEEMKSTHDWLHPVGDDLSDIMAQNKANIKDHLQPIVEHYPDFSKKHLIAVLYFRGLLRGRKHRLILQRLSELKRSSGNGGNRGQVLFGDMQVAVNTDCLSSLPFSCLSFLRPNN
uniref:exocyst complex component 3-like protein 4 n=1 Tax=Scatophagus argus TaxID=75038 RepID=UPI001ED7FB08|nr:exocyst complex component 3-like protein 4 [Scatophagus argus]